MRQPQRPPEIYDLEARVLRTLASPLRLQIIEALAEGPLRVSALAERLEIPQPSMSQNLSILRSVGIVERVREGDGLRYQLTDPEVGHAIGWLSTLARRRLARFGQLAGSYEP